jgi:transaldolase
MADPLDDLSAQGVSVWLDDLSRELLAGGELADLIRNEHVVGVTTNPTIFASALAKGDRYDDQIRSLAEAGTDVDQTIFLITTDDVRTACDVFQPVYESTGHVDGRVSIEVDPGMARDTAATIEAAKLLWSTVDRPNLLVKIPATVEGIPAIQAVIADGISVNVTLIFSLERYRAVMNAYLGGLERAHDAGIDLSTIHSVASFFISRVDTETDRRLTAIGTGTARALKGRAAIANAQLAYEAYEETFSGDRWDALAAAGAHKQRPLWASTGVKDPAYPDTLYIGGIVAPNTVNTMPGATLAAFADHGTLTGDTLHSNYAAAAEHMQALKAIGIDFDDITRVLETEGLEKFVASWAELGQTVSRQLQLAASR